MNDEVKTDAITSSFIVHHSYFSSMSQTKHEIQAILASANTEPRHRFGQNFMIDQNLVRVVAEAGELTKEDVVIEVGPGTGTLTEELLERAGKVIAVEIDRDLARMLGERFGARENFLLIEGDALESKHELNPELLRASHVAATPASPQVSKYKGNAGVAATNGGAHLKLVANLPYNIASPLIINLLIAGVDLLAFTVQKEVADRLRASAASGEYGTLTVMAQMLAKVEVLRTLPPQAFWPAPKIDSALVRMRREDRLGNHAAAFGQFVQKLFSARRKTLRKAMSLAGIENAALLDSLGIDPQLRPEVLSVEQFWGIFHGAGLASQSST
jgi:16S rRNA (adenine1518-N6/adenine1519-N6)-dimethyltransferase